MNDRCTCLLLVMGLSLLIGCNQQTDPTPASQTQNSPPPDPDDAAAVEALEAAATSLKRDGDGFVTEVNFRGTTIDDGPLQHLAFGTDTI